MTLTLKRLQTHTAEFEFSFEARELSEQFTDEQLRTAGLYRSLRDADISRLHDLEKRESAARCSCEDDECECACHTHRACHGGPSHPAGVTRDRLSEADFWPLVRALVLRRDYAVLVGEIERRAWEIGNTTVDLSHLLRTGS